MDKINIQEKVAQFISARKFAAAKKEVAVLEVNELSEMLSVIAYNLDSIIVYAFICSLIADEELSEYHIFAAEVLVIPLFSIPGAYNTALYHTKRALEIAPGRVDYKEFLLFFYGIPEQLLRKDEALKIAQEIIRVDSANETALDIISEIAKEK